MFVICIPCLGKRFFPTSYCLCPIALIAEGLLAAMKFILVLCLVVSAAALKTSSLAKDLDVSLKERPIMKVVNCVA